MPRMSIKKKCSPLNNSTLIAWRIDPRGVAAAGLTVWQHRLPSDRGLAEH